MPYVRPDIAKAVAENDLDAVVFTDPLADDARKAKRNLVAASFAAILISALDLQINGFLGLQTATGEALGIAVTKGLACLVVLYFLAGFVLSTFIDYSAWKFKRERVLVRPYLDLIQVLESHLATTGEQVANATTRLDGVVVETGMQSEVAFKREIGSAKGQLTSIQQRVQSLHEEFAPLIAHWSATVAKATRLSWRLRARFLSLWLVDIATPLLLAAVAIWRTGSGMSSVWTKMAA